MQFTKLGPVPCTSLTCPETNPVHDASWTAKQGDAYITEPTGFEKFRGLDEKLVDKMDMHQLYPLDTTWSMVSRHKRMWTQADIHALKSKHAHKILQRCGL